MKFVKLAIAFLACSLMFCGCAKNSDVVLKINDKNITRAEFNEDFKRVKNAQLKNAPKEFQKDDSYAVLAIKDRYINDVIIKTLLVDEFEKRKITASEEEIKARVDKAIALIGSAEKFNNILRENDISQERLNSDMAMEVKIEKLLDLINTKKVSDNDVLKYYKNNKEQFSAQERVRASHILMETDVNSIKRKLSEEDKEAKLSNEELDKKANEIAKNNLAKLEEIRKKVVNNPKSFAQLAKEYSQDYVSAQKGGDLGYIVKNELVKEFGDMAFSQKVGTISPIVKTQYGSHIIYVKDKASKGIQPYNEVKSDIKAFLIRKNKMDAMKNLVEGLKANSKIEFVDESLKPENIRKQIETALIKQQDMQKKLGAPKSKLKTLEKMDKE